MGGPHYTPPGWYPDPGGGQGQRYWDGYRWTAQRGQSRPWQGSPSWQGPPGATSPWQGPAAALPKPPMSNALKLGILGAVVVASIVFWVVVLNWDSRHEPSYELGQQTGRSSAASLARNGVGERDACESALSLMYQFDELDHQIPAGFVQEDFMAGCLDALGAA